MYCTQSDFLFRNMLQKHFFKLKCLVTNKSKTKPVLL